MQPKPEEPDDRQNFQQTPRPPLTQPPYIPNMYRYSQEPDIPTFQAAPSAFQYQAQHPNMAPQNSTQQARPLRRGSSAIAASAYGPPAPNPYVQRYYVSQNMVMYPQGPVPRPFVTRPPVPIGFVPQPPPRPVIMQQPFQFNPQMQYVPIKQQSVYPANQAFSRSNTPAQMYIPPMMMSQRKNSAVSIPVRFAAFQRIDSSALSKVAQYFIDHIVLNDEVVEGIEYRECFTGKHAVDILSELVIKRDRDVALVLGRAIEAQFLFHDVNWHFKLSDSRERLYEFDASTLFKDEHSKRSLPSGVFTLLTKCYSPTCGGHGCYSASCPSKINQQRLLKHLAVQSSQETSQLISDKIQTEESSSAYWSSFAPTQVVEKLEKQELTRQEVIYELIQSEKNYVYGLEIVFETFRDLIRRKNIIESSRREEFLSSLFINRQQILQAHRKLLQKLLQKQKESWVVLEIAQVFLNQIADFENYIEYAKNEPYARWIFSVEKESNPGFVQFLSDFSREPKNKRAEFDHYLRLPSTRFAGYRLQLDRILKYTSDLEEKMLLEKLLGLLTEIGQRCNSEGGKTVDNLKIVQFKKSTELTNNESKILNLSKESRQIIRSGTLVIKKLNDLQVDYTLFDHCLLFLTRKKADARRKVYKRVYPLQLVKIDELSSGINEMHLEAPVADDNSSVNSNGSTTTPAKQKEGKFTVNIEILMTEKHSFTLAFKTDAEKVSWHKALVKQKQLLEKESSYFQSKQLDDVKLECRPSCTTVYGTLFLVGHDRGVSVFDKQWYNAIELAKVAQIHIVQNCLIVLADKVLYSFDLETALSQEVPSAVKQSQAERVSTGVAFFSVGSFFHKQVLCSVKNASTEARIKLYEPRESKIEKKKGLVFKGSSFSMWNYFEELYIPSVANAIQFLNNRLCIACTKGYEIVDLNTLQSQSLLDLSDERLKSITSRDNCRSMALFKVSDGKFLLCYNAFAFFVDQYGRFTSLEYMTWQGEPLKFSKFILILVYHHPYLVCVNSCFIEVHNVNSCELVQIIPGDEITVTNEHLKHFVLQNSDFIHQLVL